MGYVRSSLVLHKGKGERTTHRDMRESLLQKMREKLLSDERNENILCFSISSNPSFGI